MATASRVQTSTYRRRFARALAVAAPLRHVSRVSESAEHWMARALAEAERAGAAGEVPIGAIVVRAEVVIAAAGNAPIARCDPTAHAEVLALRAAATALGNYRLPDCD